MVIASLALAGYKDAGWPTQWQGTGPCAECSHGLSPNNPVGYCNTHTTEVQGVAFEWVAIGQKPGPKQCVYEPETGLMWAGLGDGSTVSVIPSDEVRDAPTTPEEATALNKRNAEAWTALQTNWRDQLRKFPG